MTSGPMEPKLEVWYRVIGRYNVHIMYVGYGTEICGFCYMFTSFTYVGYDNTNFFVIFHSFNV